MLFRVQVPSLLRLEELRSNGEGGSIPPESSEEVGAAGLLPDPAFRCEFRGSTLEVWLPGAGRQTLIATFSRGRPPALLLTQAALLPRMRSNMSGETRNKEAR